MESVKNYMRILLNIAIPLTGIVLVCLAGPKLLVFFMPFVIGWLIAMIANPLVRFLEKRMKIVRKHSSAMIIVAVLAVVIGLGYFLISRRLIQAVSLAKELPELYEALSLELDSLFLRFDRLLWVLPVPPGYCCRSLRNRRRLCRSAGAAA